MNMTLQVFFILDFFIASLLSISKVINEEKILIIVTHFVRLLRFEIKFI